VRVLRIFAFNNNNLPINLQNGVSPTDPGLHRGASILKTPCPHCANPTYATDQWSHGSDGCTF